jgi:HAD superfamily hydrolase (TIGR01549 family)
MTPLLFDTMLFDVDGTLLDSNGAHAEAWTRSLQEHGIPADVRRLRSLVGMGGDKLLPAVAQVSEDSDLGRALATRKKEIFASLLPALRPTPGARTLLEYLGEQRVNIVIATSADEHELRALLTQAGIDDLVPERASKDDASASKPDPDIIHAALRRSGATSADSVMIGDTPYDIEAASRAAVATIALRCGGHWRDHDFHGALAILDDPAALLLFLRATKDLMSDADRRELHTPGNL